MGAFWGTVATGAVAGFASGVIMTGSLKGGLAGAIWGAVGAFAAFTGAELAGRLAGVGSKTAHLASLIKTGLTKLTAIKTLIHGLSSGIISYFRGGSFRAGFYSGLGSAFDVGTKGYGGMVGRTSIMAIIGGTFAKLGGGKFANGAMSGAFTHLFNDEYDNLFLRGKGVARALGGDGGITDKQAKQNDQISLAIAGGVGVVSGTGILVIKYGAKGAIIIISTVIVEISGVSIEGKFIKSRPSTPREQQIRRNIEEDMIRESGKVKSGGK